MWLYDCYLPLFVTDLSALCKISLLIVMYSRHTQYKYRMPRKDAIEAAKNMMVYTVVSPKILTLE